MCALYPDLMNIYADRGNLLLLERRCALAGDRLRAAVQRSGRRLDPDGADLYYIGGGQDRDQRLCALDLAEVKRDALHAVAARGGVILAVCGGYQLLGRSYQLGDETLPGVGLVDLETVRAERAAADRQRRDRGRARARATGASSPASRTTAAAPTSARARGRSGACCRATATTGATAMRACATRNVIGTYLHGPLLPKNAWFADWLIRTALGPDEPLAPLDDELEAAAHADARRAAGV